MTLFRIPSRDKNHSGSTKNVSKELEKDNFEENISTPDLPKNPILLYVNYISEKSKPRCEKIEEFLRKANIKYKA